MEKKKKQFEEETRLKKINAGELAVEQMQKVFFFFYITLDPRVE